MDDAALVQAARTGDDTAWAAIYDRYADKLHDHCYRILRDRDEAADALHDAFIAGARNLHQLRDPSRLRPWLYSICRHTSLRRLKQRDRVELTDAPDDMSAPDPDLDRGVRAQELGELVWAAAAGLNGRDQALLDLHLRQGLEGQDLADAMGTSLSNSYVMLSRMRDQVERSLGALLIARMGREDCEELDAILDGWDGRFSPLLRKRVARHVDGCEVCAEKKRTVASPLALLAAAPLVPAPALLKARVISSIRNVEVVDPPHVPFTKDGFAALGPGGGAHRVRAAWLAVAAALLLVLGGGVLLAAGDDDDPVETAALEAPRERSRSSSTVDAATTTSTADALAPPADGGTDEGRSGGPDGMTGGFGGSGGSTGGTTGGGTTGGGGATGGGSSGGGATGGDPADPGTTTTTRAPATTTTNDGFGPTISNLRVAPGACAATGRTVTLTVRAVDPAGVDRANITTSPGSGVSPTGKTAMQRAGGEDWQKVVTVPAGGGSFTVVIEAIDGNGIDTDDPFSFRVAACPTDTNIPGDGPG